MEIRGIRDVERILRSDLCEEYDFSHSTREQKITYGDATHVGDAFFKELPKETIHTYTWVWKRLSNGKDLVVTIETDKELASNILFVEHDDITVKVGEKRIGIPSFIGMCQISFEETAQPTPHEIAKVLVAGMLVS